MIPVPDEPLRSASTLEQDRDRRVGELAERIRRRRAQGDADRLTLSDEAIERLRNLLPRTRQLLPAPGRDGSTS